MTLPIIGGLLVGFSVGAVAGWMARSAASGAPPEPGSSQDEAADALDGARAELAAARTALAGAEERAQVAEAALEVAAGAAGTAPSGVDAAAHEKLKLKHDVLAQRVREAEAALEICQDRCNRLREKADVTDALEKQLKTARDRAGTLEEQLAGARQSASAPPIDGPTLLPDDVPAPSPLDEEPTQPQPDDLRSIPGVGPKIERLLRANGVQTFAQLAACTPDQVRDYLTQGGAHMAKYDPAPWIEEAGARTRG